MFCANCGTKNADSAATCTTCGNTLARPVLALRREGDNLVIPIGASLPPYCVKCGQPSAGVVNKNFGWHQPWLYLLILFPGLLIYAIVATIVMKRQKIQVPLCDPHRQRRRMYLGIGWLLFLGCIPAGIWVGTSGPDMDGWGMLVGFGAFFASLVLFALGSRVMAPKVITDVAGTYGGVSPAFLQYVEMQPQAAGAGR
jgi:hypothetical protein